MWSWAHICTYWALKFINLVYLIGVVVMNAMGSIIIKVCKSSVMHAVVYLVLSFDLSWRWDSWWVLVKLFLYTICMICCILTKKIRVTSLFALWFKLVGVRVCISLLLVTMTRFWWFYVGDDEMILSFSVILNRILLINFLYDFRFYFVKLVNFLQL